MKKIKSTIAVVLALMILVTTMAIPVSAAGQTTIKLKQGDNLSYGTGYGWTTHMITADGKMTYCINPHKPLPADGTYSTDNNNLYEYTSSMSNYDLFRKALYYCYGGDGFNTSNYFVTDTSKHQKVYDGDTMAAFMGNLKYSEGGFEALEPGSTTLHYLLTHRTLAYINGDSEWDYGIYADWQNAIRDIVEVLKKAPTPPVNTKMYILNLGDAYQNVIVQKTAVKLQLQKSSANTALTDNNSCYSLDGAKYNIYLDEKCTDYFGSITTNASGYGQYNGGADVPLQSYYAKEVTAPKGYALDKTVYKFADTGTKVDSSAIYSVNCKDKPQNDPVAIMLKKVDSQNNTIAIADAEFTITYYKGFYETEAELKNTSAERSWVLKTDSDGYSELSKDYLVFGDDFYLNSSGEVTLPLGTITIKETKAPVGYEINDELFIRQVTSNGSIEGVGTYNAPTILEKKTETGKIKIMKQDSQAKNPLARAVFGIYTSSTTDDKGNLLESNKIDTVTTDTDGIAISKGLTIGTYYVQELTAPKGYILDNTVYKADVTVDNTDDNPTTITAMNKAAKGSLRVIKTAEDNFVEGIEFRLFGTSINGTRVDMTAKTNADGIAAFEDVLVGNYNIEEVNTAEQYIVPIKQTATVEWSKETTVNVKNVLKRGSIKVVKTAEDNFVEGIEFRLFGTSINGTRVDMTVKTNADGIAAFEDVLVGNYNIEEVNTKSYYIVPDQQTGIIQWDKVSTISFENLLKKGSVEVKKTSEDKLTEGFRFRLHGTSLSGAAIDMVATTNADGTAMFSDVLIGSYQVEEIDTPPEYIQPSSQPVTVSYDDIFQAGLTSNLSFYNELKKVKIHTTAIDKSTGTHQGYASPTTTIVDTVALPTGLIDGKEYTIKGYQYDKATGNKLLVNGNKVTSEKIFTYTSGMESVELEFTFDSSALKGTSVVAFEYLYYNSVEIAAHADITDEGQTVEFKSPTVHTTAKDTSTNSNQAYAHKDTTIIDIVEYTNLIIGKEYTVKGALMDKATGEPLKNREEEITATKTFTAGQSTGAVNIEFTFDSSLLRGNAVVAFENLYYKDIEIATHADINDEGQTVTFENPEVHTTAQEKVTGSHTTDVNKNTTIVDKVEYKNLIVGKEYTINGTLMNKATGKPLEVNGKQVAATKTFVATQENDFENIEFTFDSTALEGISVVVFESLLYNNIEIATHSDINDNGQTVSFNVNPTEAPTPPATQQSTVAPAAVNTNVAGDTAAAAPNGDAVTTGDTTTGWLAICIAALLISISVCSAIIIKKRRQNSNK